MLEGVFKSLVLPPKQLGLTAIKVAFQHSPPLVLKATRLDHDKHKWPTNGSRIGSDTN